MPDKKIDHDRTDVRLELVIEHPLDKLLAVHQYELLHLIIARAERYVNAIGARSCRQVHVIDVKHLAVVLARARVDVCESDRPDGLGAGLDETDR